MGGMRLGKRVSTKREEIRTAYVQQNFCGGGIQLEDLRQLVEATRDYDPMSHVTLERHRVKVVEHLGANSWRKFGDS